MAATIPVLIFAGAIALGAANQHRAAAQSAARAVVDRAAERIASAISAEVQVAEMLALSDALDQPNLAAFHEEARRIDLARPLWSAIALDDLDGQQVLNTRLPLDARLGPSADRESLARVLQSRRTIVGGPGPQRHVFLRVPVMRAGELRFVLTVSLDTRAIAEILAGAGLPAGWMGAIVDGRVNEIVRIPAGAPGLDQTASSARDAALARSSEGRYQARTREGVEVTTVFRTLPEAGNWSIHVAIPTEYLDRPVRHALFALAGGVTASVALAIGLAVIVSFELSRQRHGEDRRTSAVLREVEQRAAVAVEAVQLGTWRWDFVRDEMTGSSRWLTQMNLSMGEGAVPLSLFLNAIHPEDRGEVERVFRRCADKSIRVLEADFRTPIKGGWRWLKAVGRPDADGGSSIVGVLADVGVHKRAEALRLNLLRRLAEAQESIQGRIARELHDQVGQTVTALSLGLKRLEQSLDALGAQASLSSEHLPPLKEQVGWMRSLSGEIGRDIHRAAADLRPTALDDLGLPRALTAYAEDWRRRYGVAVDIQLVGTGNERLPADVETTVYRVVIEALTNVAKHACASHVSLMLERRRGELRCVVEDDGKGLTLPIDGIGANPGSDRQRLGLLGMRERLSLIGGALNVETQAGRGTTLFIQIPLPDRAGKRQTDDK